MRTTIWASALSLGIAAALAAPKAHALGPVDLELGARVGGGNTPGGLKEPNPLGFGAGARAGVSILGLYGGLSFMYYFGESQTQTFGPVSGSVSAHSLLYGVEAGYGSKLGPLSLRAQVGVGNFGQTFSGQAALGSTSGSTSRTDNLLYVEPGVMAMIAFGTVFIGADANVLILPDLPDETGGNKALEAAFTAHGQVGVTF